MHVLHNCFGFVINTTAYHLDRYKPSNPSTKDLIDLIASSNREIVKRLFFDINHDPSFSLYLKLPHIVSNNWAEKICENHLRLECVPFERRTRRTVWPGLSKIAQSGHTGTGLLFYITFIHFNAMYLWKNNQRIDRSGGPLGGIRTATLCVNRLAAADNWSRFTFLFRVEHLRLVRERKNHS